MEENRRNFFGDIAGMFKGLVKPAEYIKNGKFGSMGAAIMVALIFALLTPFLTFYLPSNKAIGNGKLAAEVEENIVDFKLDSTGFHCPERYEWGDSSNASYICVDTDRAYVDMDEFEDLLDEKRYSTVVIITSQEMLFYDGSDKQIVTWSSLYEYAKNSYGETEFNKSLIVDIIEIYDSVVINVGYVIGVIISFIGFFACCALWGLIGLLFASIFNVKISYATLFKASIYIRAIWYFAKKLAKAYLIKSMGGFAWVIAFTIILIYLMLAVMQYKKKYAHDDMSENYGQPAGMYQNNMYQGDMYSGMDINSTPYGMNNTSNSLGYGNMPVMGYENSQTQGQQTDNAMEKTSQNYQQ